MKKIFKNDKVREIVTYLIAGVLTTIISWGAYPVFKNLLHCSVFISSLLSWVVAFLFAFVINKLWVFESKSWEPKLATKEFIGFLSSRAFTGALEVFLVPGFVKVGIDTFFVNIIKAFPIALPEKITGILSTEGMCSKISVSVIVIVLNYVFSKLFVFKNKKNPAPKAEAENAEQTEQS